MIDIPDQYRSIILTILKKYFSREKIYFFGSRAHGAARAHSDLDIAILGKEKTSLTCLALAEEEFSSSKLPFRVDIVDLCRCDASFREKVEREGVEVGL